MHLVIVSPFPPAITGIGQYGYHVTRALEKSGAFSRVTVLAGSSIDGERPNHLGNTEIDYCWQPGQWQARTAILSRVKRLNPDLIWFNLRAAMFGESPWLSVSGLMTPLMARRMGFPTVVTFHELVELCDFKTLSAPGGIFAPWGARLITTLATQADVVCLTMQKHLNWFAVERPHVDCTHIPLSTYHEPVLMNDNGRMELLVFNMLAPFRGIELLLEVFPKLKEEFPRLLLTVAGEEHPRFVGYSRMIRERYGHIKGVRWLGRIPDEDVPELFQGARIVILPYQASTGASSSLYQAAGSGRAIVASDLGEIRALVQEENFQVEFFETGNPESLRHAIRNLLNSPEKRSAQVLHNFSSIQNSRIENTCRRYLQAFNRALEKRNSLKRIHVPQIGIETA